MAGEKRPPWAGRALAGPFGGPSGWDEMAVSGEGDGLRQGGRRGLCARPAFVPLSGRSEAHRCHA